MPGAPSLLTPKLTEEDLRDCKLDPTTARIIRIYLERVALALERHHVSTAYKAPMKFAARSIRAMKPD